jgi:carbonic anhydrase/acetyltransferase-like protein (isoleucine patch superfamily)
MQRSLGCGCVKVSGLRTLPEPSASPGREQPQRWCERIPTPRQGRRRLSLGRVPILVRSPSGLEHQGGSVPAPEKHLADEVNLTLTLERSLTRMRAALASATALQATPRLPAVGRWGAALVGLSASCFLLLAGTGADVFLPLAMGFGVSGGILFARGWTQRRPPAPGAPARIGLGATVFSDAVVEPGAVVEMGATIRTGATVRSGALVGMGATVGANAIVETGAVVSWGATVRAGAVIGANAVVGWGATVGKGVRIPAGMRLRAGATVSAGWLRERLPSPALASSPARDPSEVRAAVVCDRLASEWRAAPEHVRSFLGTSDTTIASLRRTCEELVRREQALRAELDPGALVRLDEERTALDERLATETDERIRSSLAGTVVAINEQRRQRELLRLSADRLQAERMRLVYTLEGLASQFVRLRTAGAEAGRASAADLEQGVKELGAELNAIADALEEESQDVPVAKERVRG